MIAAKTAIRHGLGRAHSKVPGSGIAVKPHQARNGMETAMAMAMAMVNPLHTPVVCNSQVVQTMIGSMVWLY